MDVMTEVKFKTDGAQIILYPEAPDWEGPAAALGAFRAATPEAGREVLAQAMAHARSLGIRRLIGPMDGDTWHSYRFVTETDGSPAFLLEPQNKPHDVDVFRDAGFQPIGGYFSARVPLDARLASAPPPATDLTIQTWNGEDPEGLFAQVHDLSVQAFSKNAFYKPILREAFLAMYMPVVPMIRPELIFFARHNDGKLAGFLFGIPNYAEGPKPSSAILKTYASLARGAGRHLAHAFHTVAAGLGYQSAIHALIHDDNLSGLRSAAEGAEVFRRYTLFGLRLDG